MSKPDLIDLQQSDAKKKSPFMDYQTACFLSGQQFLDSNPSQNAVLILDNNMPGLSGNDVLQKMNQNKLYLPTICMSGVHGSFSDVEEAYPFVVAVLDKPFRIRNLIAAIEKGFSQGLAT